MFVCSFFFFFFAWRSLLEQLCLGCMCGWGGPDGSSPRTHLSLCCSVFESCPTPCNPMDYSTEGFPVLHCLLEFAQTQVNWVGDAIQRPHPLLPLGGEFSDMLCLRLGIPDKSSEQKVKCNSLTWGGVQDAALGQWVNREEKVAKKEQRSSQGRCLQPHPAVETGSRAEDIPRCSPAVIIWDPLPGLTGPTHFGFYHSGWISLWTPVNAFRKGNLGAEGYNPSVPKRRGHWMWVGCSWLLIYISQ